MYEPVETTNIPVEDTSNVQSHQQIASRPDSIAGHSTQKLGDLIILSVTNDLQNFESTQTPHQQQIFRVVIPDKNDTVQTTASTEQAYNSTANTDQYLSLSAPYQNLPSVARKDRRSSYIL